MSSGQTIKDLELASVDHYDQIVTTDNANSISILAGQNVTISGTSKMSTIQGIASFKDLKISAQPGTFVNVTINSKLSSVSPISVNVTLRECNPGEIIEGVECILCIPETYSLNTQDSECTPCPQNAICYGGFDIVPQEGYWRSRNDSDTIWKCQISEACIGGQKDANNTLSYTCLLYTSPSPRDS